MAAPLERYRHLELGCSPTAGCFSDQEGLARVIGPRPGDDLSRLQWDCAVETVAPEPDLGVEVG